MLGCFYPLAVVNSIAVNMMFKYLSLYFQFFWIYAYEQNCWIICQFHVYVFEELPTVFCISCIIFVSPAIAWEFPLVLFLLLLPLLLVSNPKNHCQGGCQGWKFKFWWSPIYLFFSFVHALDVIFRKCCQTMKIYSFYVVICMYMFV